MTKGKEQVHSVAFRKEQVLRKAFSLGQAAFNSNVDRSWQLDDHLTRLIAQEPNFYWAEIARRWIDGWDNANIIAPIL